MNFRRPRTTKSIEVSANIYASEFSKPCSTITGGYPQTQHHPDIIKHVIFHGPSPITIVGHQTFNIHNRKMEGLSRAEFGEANQRECLRKLMFQPWSKAKIELQQTKRGFNHVKPVNTHSELAKISAIFVKA